MIAQRRVFLCGTFTFRRSVSPWLIVAFLIASFGFAALGAVVLRFDDGPLAAVPILLAIVLFVLGINWTWHYARNHVDELRIDEDGVRCGKESWSWERLKAIRVLPRPRGYIILIWPRRDRGVGRGLPLDNPLSAADAQRLVQELAAFAEERHLQFKCGEYPRHGRRESQAR